MTQMLKEIDLVILKEKLTETQKEIQKVIQKDLQKEKHLVIR